MGLVGRVGTGFSLSRFQPSFLAVRQGKLLTSPGLSGYIGKIGIIISLISRIK